MLVTVPACPLPVTFVHGGHALVGGSMTGKVGLWDLGMGKMHSLVLNSKLFETYMIVGVLLLLVSQKVAKFSLSM